MLGIVTFRIQLGRKAFYPLNHTSRARLQLGNLTVSIIPKPINFPTGNFLGKMSFAKLETHLLSQRRLFMRRIEIHIILTCSFIFKRRKRKRGMWSFPMM
jgi:hypothetical protein